MARPGAAGGTDPALPGGRRDALRRAAQACRALVLISPPAALTLALLVDEPAATTRIAFVLIALATALVTIGGLTHLLSRLAHPGDDVAAATRGSTVALALSAIPWPLALVMLVPRTADETYLVLFFCVAAAAASLTASAAYRPFFAALVGCNLGPVTILIARGALAPEVPRGLSFMSLLFIAILYISFRLVNRTIVEAVDAQVMEAALSAQLSEANARLAHRASHDDLTALANRSLFRDVLERHVAEGAPDGDPVAVLYIDLDRFKVVNDSVGHIEGDALLREVAERLRHCVRGNDLLARLGGDEFTVVAPGVDEASAIALGERVRHAFDDPFVVGGLHTVVSVSVGVALGRPGMSATDLMRYADAALYEAKGSGRNRVVLFDDAMRAWLSTRLERENALRHALQAQEFEAWFQPVVDPRSRQIVAAEALARWHHPRRGILSPALFLPLMAECGLVGQLDDEISRQARAVRASLDAVAEPGFRVYVNVSPGAEPLATTIERQLAAAEADGVALTGLGIEITEQALVADPASASVALVRARDHGLAVALDDVGTGYSSLSLIRTLPLDGLKIDGSFVQGMSSDPADAAVVSAVAALGRRLGLGVTAEGVETERQLSAVIAEGVTTVQGFLFAGPVPAATLEEWLREGPPWADAAPVIRIVR